MEVNVQVRDWATPRLRRMAERIKNARPLMLSIGVQLTSMAQRSFTESTLRAATWHEKKDGTPATLYKRGVLKQSLRVTSADARSVTVGSDRPYAAIHQFGGRTRPHVIRPKHRKALRWGSGAAAHFATEVHHPGSRIPARPFFPFDAQGSLTTDASDAVRSLIVAHVRRANA